MSETIRPCTTCPQLTRPTHLLARDFPGTRIRVGGQCEMCNGRRKKVDVRQNHEYNLRGLNAFLARRREREARLERVRA